MVPSRTVSAHVAPDTRSSNDAASLCCNSPPHPCQGLAGVVRTPPAH